MPESKIEREVEMTPDLQEALRLIEIIYRREQWSDDPMQMETDVMDWREDAGTFLEKHGRPA